MEEARSGNTGQNKTPIEEEGTNQGNKDDLAKENLSNRYNGLERAIQMEGEERGTNATTITDVENQEKEESTTNSQRTERRTTAPTPLLTSVTSASTKRIHNGNWNKNKSQPPRSYSPTPIRAHHVTSHAST